MRKRRSSGVQKRLAGGDCTREGWQKKSGGAGPEMWHVLGVVSKGTGKLRLQLNRCLALELRQRITALALPRFAHVMARPHSPSRRRKKFALAAKHEKPLEWII